MRVGRHTPCADRVTDHENPRRTPCEAHGNLRHTPSEVHEDLRRHDAEVDPHTPYAAHVTGHENPRRTACEAHVTAHENLRHRDVADDRRIPCVVHARDVRWHPCAAHVTDYENLRHRDAADDPRIPCEAHEDLRHRDAGGENHLRGYRMGDPRPRVYGDQKKDGQDGHPWVHHHVKRGAENEGGRLT